MSRRIRISIVALALFAVVAVSIPAASLGVTGKRGAALAKCQKKKGHARKVCKTRAMKLPV
jgi:hypothetical protein